MDQSGLSSLKPSSNPKVMLLVVQCSEIHTTLIGFSGSEWIVFIETIKQSQGDASSGTMQ